MQGSSGEKSEVRPLRLTGLMSQTSSTANMKSASKLRRDGSLGRRRRKTVATTPVANTSLFQAANYLHRIYNKILELIQLAFEWRLVADEGLDMFDVPEFLHCPESSDTFGTKDIA